MIISNPFKMPKPRRFHYTPLYYDERKERLQKMKDAAEAARDGKAVSRLERGFLNNQRATRISAEAGPVLRRLVIIAIVIAVLVAIVFPRLDGLAAFLHSYYGR